MRACFAFVLGLSILLTACTGSTVLQRTEAPAPIEGTTEMIEPNISFELTSAAFKQGESIPVKYSCQGEDVSPPLAWSEPPFGTKSLALIMEDPDAPIGTWDHWILFNIPADRRELQEDLPITGKNVDPDAIYVGSNS